MAFFDTKNRAGTQPGGAGVVLFPGSAENGARHSSPPPIRPGRPRLTPGLARIVNNWRGWEDTGRAGEGQGRQDDSTGRPGGGSTQPTAMSVWT